jgi:hypothetical protein
MRLPPLRLPLRPGRRRGSGRPASPRPSIAPAASRMPPRGTEPPDHRAATRPAASSPPAFSPYDQIHCVSGYIGSAAVHSMSRGGREATSRMRRSRFLPGSLRGVSRGALLVGFTGFELAARRHGGGFAVSDAGDGEAHTAVEASTCVLAAVRPKFKGSAQRRRGSRSWRRRRRISAWRLY